MNKYKITAILLMATVITSIFSSCSSLKDVSSTIPKLFQNVWSDTGKGSPNAEILLTANYPKIPTQLVVYKVTTKVDDAWALNKAKLFGLDNNPVPLVGGKRQVYSHANDETVLEINLDGRMNLYQRNNSTNTYAQLPSENECVNIASKWLKSKGLYPDNVLRVKVGVSETIASAENGTTPTKEIPVKMSIAVITARNGYEIYPTTASLTVGNKDKVLELSYNNPDTSEYGMVNLKTPDSAFIVLNDYLKDASFNPVYADECIANWRGFQKLVISNISLQYTIASGYLLPCYVFEGNIYLVNQKEPKHFEARVDAIKR